VYIWWVSAVWGMKVKGGSEMIVEDEEVVVVVKKNSVSTRRGGWTIFLPWRSEVQIGGVVGDVRIEEECVLFEVKLLDWSG
jgi:hypothetical protein